jgi:glucokinase
MAALYAPDLIRIGGGLAVGGGESFIQKAREVMEEHLKLVPAPRVELSRLGYDTALRGAIAIALADENH